MGYGQLTMNGARQYVHRLAYELANGSAATDNVCHRCDTPLCCNPAHLFVGTQAENIADMRVKGRHRNNPRRGEGASWSKLTDAKVRSIRKAVAGGAEMRPTARAFGVAQSTVQRVVRRQTWKHV